MSFSMNVKTEPMNEESHFSESAASFNNPCFEFIPIEIKKDEIEGCVEPTDAGMDINSFQIKSEPGHSDVSTSQFLPHDQPDMPGSRKYLYRHFLAHNEGKRYKCPVPNCEYDSNQKMYLATHMKIHSGEKPFVCVHCDYRTHNIVLLKRHVEVHTKCYICPQCKFRTPHRINFENHLLVHSDSKPYRCEQCGFSTHLKSLLKQHNFKHSTEEKKYICPHLGCNFKSHTKRSVNVHYLTHDEVKMYRCSHCDFSTHRRHSLQYHLVSHTTDKKFKCDKCTFETHYSASMKNHLVSHTPDKKFKCDKCTFETHYSANMKRHALEHTLGTRKFKCSKCDFTTHLKGILTGHEFTHEFITPEQAVDMGTGKKRMGNKGIPRIKNEK